MRTLTINAASAVRIATYPLIRFARMPTSTDAPQVMALLADSMQHLSDLGATLDGKCRIGSQNAVAAAVASNYEQLFMSFAALRHNAHETRTVFLNAKEPYERIKNATRART